MGNGDSENAGGDGHQHGRDEESPWRGEGQCGDPA